MELPAQHHPAKDFWFLNLRSRPLFLALPLHLPPSLFTGRLVPTLFSTVRQQQAT